MSSADTKVAQVTRNKSLTSLRSKEQRSMSQC